MVRVAIVLPSLSNAATITVAFNIASGLVGLGHDVDILYFDLKVERPIPSGCNAYKIGFLSFHDFSKYDVVHSHNLRPDLYVAAHRIFKKFSCVSTIHNYVAEELENYYGKITSLVFSRIWLFAWRRFGGLVCLTNGAVEYYKSLLPEANITYVYNGVSVGDCGAMPDQGILSAVASLKQRNYFVLGTYCNQTKGKGLEQLIRFAKADPSVAVVIIGSGPENRQLMSLAADLGVEGRCLFFPYFPNAYIYNKYFDSYIITSRKEGFGLALVEAALYGSNIICSDIEVFREIFNDEQVFFFQLDDMDGIGRAVQQIKLGASKGALAKNKAVKEFSIEAMTRRYLEVYHDAMSRLAKAKA